MTKQTRQALTGFYWVCLYDKDNEEGAEASEYLALTGAVLLLMVAIGLFFRQEGTQAVAEPFLNIFKTLIEGMLSFVERLV